MAERYDSARGRTRDDQMDRQPYDRDRWERGMVERGADEVRSWFGDDDAQRRRDMDEARERSWGPRRHGWSADRHTVGSGREWNGGDYPGYYDRGSYFRDRFDRNQWGNFDREPRQPNEADRHRSGYFDSSMGYASTSSAGNLNPFPYRGPGSFAGRGPRNFTRSDERIREDVVSRLTDDDRVDASDVDVQVQNGEVTLTGKVDNRRMRRAAEECAEDVPGVRDIHTQLRVENGNSRSHDAQAGAIGHEGSQLEREDVTSLNISPVAGKR